MTLERVFEPTSLASFRSLSLLTDLDRRHWPGGHRMPHRSVTDASQRNEPFHGDSLI